LNPKKEKMGRSGVTSVQEPDVNRRRKTADHARPCQKKQKKIDLTKIGRKRRKYKKR